MTSHSSSLIRGLAGGEGEGALSEEELYIDKHAEKEIYKTPDATSIGTASERDERDERLQEVNEGRDRFSDDHAVRMHSVDRSRIIGALCSSLPISDTERELAISTFADLDLDQFGNQKAVEKVALATIRHVVDTRRVEYGADFESLLRGSEEYQVVKDSVLLNERGFMKLCNAVSDAIERCSRSPSLAQGPDPNLPDAYPKYDYPDKYWNNLSAERWAGIAETWDHQPRKFRGSIPEEYLSLIDRLQRWEPWDDESGDDEESASNNAQGTNPPNEGLDEEVIAEAVALVEEMENRD
jgi:hypothetical protein